MKSAVIERLFNFILKVLSFFVSDRVQLLFAIFCGPGGFGKFYIPPSDA